MRAIVLVGASEPGAEARVRAELAPYFTSLPQDAPPVHGLALDGTLELPLEAVAGGVVRGRVLDADGSPLGGAEVVLTPFEILLGAAPVLTERGDALLGEPSPLIVRTRTNDSGEYRLEGCPPAAVVFARAGGRLPAQGGVLLEDDREATLDLVLPAAGDVRGRVVDERGRPLAGVRLFLAPERERRNAEPGIAEAERLAAEGRPQARTDAEGEFAFESVTSLSGSRWYLGSIAGDGDLALFADAGGYAPTWSAPLESADRAAVQLVLSRGVSLSGRVVGAAH